MIEPCVPCVSDCSGREAGAKHRRRPDAVATKSTATRRGATPKKSKKIYKILLLTNADCSFILLVTKRYLFLTLKNYETN